MKNLLSLLCIIAASQLFGQYFAPPMDNGMIGMAKSAYLITTAGDSLSGKVGAAMMVGGQIRSLTFKLNDGSKQKLKAEDIKLLAVQPNKLTNISSALSVPNLQQAMSADFDAILNREWVYFEQAMLPKKDKYALMQLMNSGFDSKIKVYQDPTANETMSPGSAMGLNITGGIDKSYLVVLDGNRAMVIRKAQYQKDALSLLYKDCPVFAENYGGEKFRWDEFAEHVLVYDQLCD